MKSMVPTVDCSVVRAGWLLSSISSHYHGGVMGDYFLCGGGLSCYLCGGAHDECTSCVWGAGGYCVPT